MVTLEPRTHERPISRIKITSTYRQEWHCKVTSAPHTDFSAHLCHRCFRPSHSQSTSRPKSTAKHIGVLSVFTSSVSKGAPWAPGIPINGQLTISTLYGEQDI